MTRTPPQRAKRLRRIAIMAAATVLLVWLAFFDSHSFYRRATWHYEASELAAENDALRIQINEIERSLENGLTAKDVERIAREQYGMRKQGETVYPEKGPADEQP